MNKDNLIEKQKELIEALRQTYPDSVVVCVEPLAIRIDELESEIAELEKQAEEPITNADIEAWAEKGAEFATDSKGKRHIIKASLFLGAKAMRDNEIKYIEK